MNPILTLDVVQFELSRSLSVGRTIIWCAMVAFPVAIVSTLRWINPIDSAEAWGLLLYFLIPEVICLLGLLLWATPAVSIEVENQTWIYLAMRQSGRTWVVLGKYLTSVVWTFAAAAVATTICVAILGSMAGFRLWLVMLGLSLLSCFTHGALYLLIGVLFYRRTMVTAVAYTLVIEYGLSLVPALANKLTVNYRLRGLIAEWMDWEGARSDAELLFGREPAWMHLLALAIYASVFLIAALIRVNQTEFPTQQDG